MASESIEYLMVIYRSFVEGLLPLRVLISR